MPPPRGPIDPLRPYAEIAWQGVVDGESKAGHHGVGTRVGAAGGRWRLAGAAAFHPAVSFRQPDATIDVERTVLGVALGVDLVGAPGAATRWRLSGDLEVGAIRYSRTTVLTSAPLEPTAPTATWAPAVMPGARLARRVGPGAWLELAVAVDLVAGAPEFGVESGGMFTVHTHLWPAQPRAGLGFVLDMF